jgi:hypothetical protein
MKIFLNNYESSLKTIDFGLKSSKWLIFNSPALEGGAIDVRDIQSFSHIEKDFGTFLDWSQLFQKKKNISYYNPHSRIFSLFFCKNLYLYRLNFQP